VSRPFALQVFQEGEKRKKKHFCKNPPPKVGGEKRKGKKTIMSEQPQSTMEKRALSPAREGEQEEMPPTKGF
jgi:hypothetical protein